MLDRDLTKTGLDKKTACILFGRMWKTTDCCCMFNAIANQARMGGKVVFGCVYMLDDNDIRRYIFGGENFTTYYDFKKP